ncbi:MAG: hypothetical protein Q4G16_09605 [Cruoricaptor ignavus]|nr:hypothetical protein [Cruoricaptor ignavus]
MKNLDTLNKNKLKPKSTTIDFILNFSKSIELVKGKNKTFLITKN